MDELRLTEWTTCGGCAAKWGGAPLRDLVKSLAGSSAGLLVGLDPFDDAAVYRLDDDTALVSTTDFFPPLVDDPSSFGAIAAANACSDVFAMGGRVILALNIAAFPEALPAAAVAAIFDSAALTVMEAGGVVAGGHTIRAPEPVFGLAVQGLVPSDRVWTKGGARPGDVLVLSKPLGTGLVLGGGSDAERESAIGGMRQLNRDSAAALRESESTAPGCVHAVTDVTGFGLMGHGWEIAERSSVAVHFDSAALPLYAGALAAAEAGTRTGGDVRNRAYLGDRTASTAPEALQAVAFDPQTSGGLLAAVDPAAVDALVSRSGFHPIGEVRSGPPIVVLS